MEKLKSFFGKKVNVISVIIGWVILLGVIGCVVTILLLNGYDLAQRTDRVITYETVTEDMGLPGGSLLDNNRGDGDTNTNTNTNTNVPVNNPSDNTGTTTTGAGAALPAGVVAPGTLQDGTLRLQIAYYRNDDVFLANLKAALAAGETIKLYDANGNLIAETTRIEVENGFIVAVFEDTSNLLYNTSLTFTGPTVQNGNGETVTIQGDATVSMPVTGSFTSAAAGAYKVVQTKLQNDLFGITSELETVNVEFSNTTKTDKVNRGRLDGHDLSCFYDPVSKCYYSYGTDAEIGVAIESTTMGVQVRRSKDLVNWEFVGWALDGVYPIGSMYSVTTNGQTTEVDAVGQWQPVEGTSTSINQYEYLYDESDNEYVVQYYYYTLSSDGTPVLNSQNLLTVNTYIGTAQVDVNGNVIAGTGDYTPSGAAQIIYSEEQLNQVIAADDDCKGATQYGYTQVYSASVGEGIYSLQNFKYGTEYADGQHTFWAPDAYYDTTSGKYVLYFGVTETFGSQKAVTYYATSDRPDGGYTIDDNGDGTITMSELEYHMVLNSYAGGGNVIDASIAYDYSGDNYTGDVTYYLSYGSYGGIRIAQMAYDEDRGVQMPVGNYSTGLPTGDGTLLANRTNYETNQEGSSILTYWNEEEGDYDYFLFVTDGDLYSTYDVRVSRADSITGPYSDYNGSVMTGSKTYYNYQSNATTGIGSGTKLMSSYRWTSSLVGNYTTHGSGAWSYAGFIAPGHGTWFKDADGNFKFIHHTREGGSKTGSGDDVQYTNHYLVVRDLEFVETDNGTWPVFSPGWYANEGSLQDGSMNEKHDTTYEDILGEWEYIVFTETSDRAKLLNDAVFTEAGGTKDGNGGITNAKVYYGDREGTWSFDVETKQLTISFTGVDGNGNDLPITLYAKVLVGWDVENTKGTIMFSGIDDTGIAHWGKRMYD